MIFRNLIQIILTRTLGDGGMVKNGEILVEVRFCEDDENL